MGNSIDKWDQSTWKEINDAVLVEVGKVRTAQKVFPTTKYDTNPVNVSNDVIDFSDLSIKEGQTKQYVEIFQEFALTEPQVSKESDLKTCKTLARMAAKVLALAEDTVIFQGDTKLPANVQANNLESAEHGLVGEANPKDTSDKDPNKVSVPIDVPRTTDPRPGLLFGENVFSAVADGIAKLTAKAQAPAFALFLPVKVYADTFVPPSNASLVTTAERIKPLVEGGFLEVVTLPEDKGLLVALGGDPTSLYVGGEVATEFVRQDKSRYFFRVVERIQFVSRDPRCFILFNFAPEVQQKTNRSRG